MILLLFSEPAPERGCVTIVDAAIFNLTVLDGATGIVTLTDVGCGP